MLRRSARALLPPGVHAVDRVADLPREDWDALTGPGDIFLTCRWLEVVEATAGVPMAYLWTERAGRPVAALATALATTSVPWALGRPDVVLTKSAEEELPGAGELLAGLAADPSERLMPSLVTGGRHVGGTRLLHAPEATPEDLAALVQAAEVLGKEAGARSVCFLYLDERDTALGQVLGGRGYRTCVTGWFSALEVPDGGFPAYLAALPSRKRRVSVAAERRRIAESDVSVGLEELDSADFPASRSWSRSCWRNTPSTSRRNSSCPCSTRPGSASAATRWPPSPGRRARSWASRRSCATATTGPPARPATTTPTSGVPASRSTSNSSTTSWSRKPPRPGSAR